MSCPCPCHQGKVAPHDSFVCPECGEWNPYESKQAVHQSRNRQCPYCHLLMNKGNGCTDRTYDDFADGIERERIPYEPDDSERYCHDCNVGSGQLHHPGCDMERCPKCGWQAISCYCPASVQAEIEVEDPDIQFST